MKKVNENGIYCHKGNNGRPSKCSSAILEHISKKNKENSKTSLRKMAKSLGKECNFEISYVSIKKYLNNMGIFTYSPIKKPFLSPNHISFRY